MICTILPKTQNCEVQKLDLFHKTIGGTCFDKMFSGHAAFCIIMTLLLYRALRFLNGTFYFFN
jgi:hypothetical protein